MDRFDRCWTQTSQNQVPNFLDGVRDLENEGQGQVKVKYRYYTQIEGVWMGNENFGFRDLEKRGQGQVKARFRYYTQTVGEWKHWRQTGERPSKIEKLAACYCAYALSNNSNRVWRTCNAMRKCKMSTGEYVLFDIIDTALKPFDGTRHNLNGRGRASPAACQRSSSDLNDRRCCGQKCIIYRFCHNFKGVRLIFT